MFWATGCSSLGLSLYPTGHFLTEQAECVVGQAPRRANLPRELNQTVLPAHYLQPGDVLLVEPVDFESRARLPADQTVMADGTIDLSGFGRVIVAGLTLEEAERLIETTIVDSGAESTQINVRLIEPVHRYYVIGEVASPGSYPLTGNENVLDGILAAGGLTSQAAPCDLLLTRPTPPTSCRVTLPICYREITQLGDTSTNYQLQPGDRIFVGTRSCCDELMFWTANQTCDRCCNVQVACSDPNIANFFNPLGSFLASPPSSPARPSSDEKTGSESAKENSQTRQQQSPERGQQEGTAFEVSDQYKPEALDLPPLGQIRRQSPPVTSDDQGSGLNRRDGELQFRDPFPAP